MEWESFFVRTASILELAREQMTQQLAEQAMELSPPPGERVI
jgi:hypothetical protein